MSDKISIIVPVYNLEDYIERTVASVQVQTYQNLEIILVDDGSKDNSLELLKRLERDDNRIKVISQENAGVTSARLTGIKAATGEWIGFVDGDDHIDSDMYERLLYNAIKYGADISHCGYKMIFPSRVDYYYNTGRLVEQDRESGLRDLLSGDFIEPGLWNKIYRKSLFDSFFYGGVLDTTIKNMEDLLMNYYLFKEADISVYEDFCPYHYILRKDSAATSKPNQHKVTDPGKVFRIIEGQETYVSLKPIIRSRKIWADLQALLVPIDEENREWLHPYQKRITGEFRDGFRANITDRNLSVKTKMCCGMAAISPGFLRKIYAIISGKKKSRYAVE